MIGTTSATHRAAVADLGATAVEYGPGLEARVRALDGDTLLAERLREAVQDIAASPLGRTAIPSGGPGAGVQRRSGGRCDPEGVGVPAGEQAHTAEWDGGVLVE